MTDWKLHGRKKPYTQIGIERLPCFRCGTKSTHQWQICADQNLFRPVCIECDIALNRLVLKFMGFKNIDEMIENYLMDFAPF